MATRCLTEFEQRVYKAVQEVPTGKVVTYSILADLLDCGSAQAIGQALKRNPSAPTVPCHRVIRADLNLGGYFGAAEGKRLERKRSLLRAEGVEFDQQDQLIDNGKIWQPQSAASRP